MNFFGKVESLPHRKGTGKDGREWESFPFILRDPNNENVSITLEIFGYDNAKHFAEQGFANGAIGTMHIYCNVVNGKNGGYFNQMRPTRWEPVGASEQHRSSVVADMPTREQVIEAQQVKDAKKADDNANSNVDILPF